MILVTGATGMFGGRVVRFLAEGGHDVRGLTRSEKNAEALRAPRVHPVVGDMADPDSLKAALEGVTTVFLVSPMDRHVARNEGNVIAAARAAEVQRIVKLYGAVRHEGDELDTLHCASIDALKASGLSWCLVSPNTVMESNLFPLADSIIHEGEIWVPAGKGRIGMVALDDVARCAATVLTTEGHDGQNYEITGPAAVTFGDIAAAFTRVLGRTVRYVDVPEEQFRRILVEQAGYPEDSIEIDVLCHFRAFREGRADLVTDTCERLTGRKAASVEEFLRDHRARFEGGAA